jgi:hypothetical protein
MSQFCQKGQLTNETEAESSTQTDIVAVHTPQMESGPGVPFPYQRVAPSARPSSLPILQTRPPLASRNPSAVPEPDAPQELKQFATSLVDSVLRTVAEQGGETEAETDKGNGPPSNKGEVYVSKKENENGAGFSKEFMMEDGCITVGENGQEIFKVNECMVNGNSAFEEVSGQTFLDAEDAQKRGTSQVGNSSCVMITTEPPSTPSTPFEQLDSPNNNQHPNEGNGIQ